MAVNAIIPFAGIKTRLKSEISPENKKVEIKTPKQNYAGLYFIKSMYRMD